MKSWLPWQYLLRVAARRRGFIDPIELLARMRRFAQPSEVQEPIELVRAGVLFHARGLINTKVFQFNLDWVWPFWVVRQFDPGDASFLPRAFSFSHVNLTHRNWTATGLPGMEDYPIVDPRGLVTLPDDPWSLDWWFVPVNGPPLYPSREREVGQQLDMGEHLRIVTDMRGPSARLRTAAWVEPATGTGEPTLVVEAAIQSDVPGHLLLVARPANPEGVHFIEEIRFGPEGWIVNGRYRLVLGQPADATMSSTYAHGDLAGIAVATNVDEGSTVKCSAGMATAGACFQVDGGASRIARATVELGPPVTRAAARHKSRPRVVRGWSESLEGAPVLQVPEPFWVFLHEAALRTVVLLSPGDIFPGPATYRRFWFRDACLVMNAMLAANLYERVSVALAGFPQRQRADGYFHSQEGEWDANGQVLWIADRFERCTAARVSAALFKALVRGAEWIPRKRAAPAHGQRHAGLLPPGFSAEHLGPVDQYYWDDLWGIAGLRAIERMMARRGEPSASHWAHEQAAFVADLRRSLDRLPSAVVQRGVPASPYRRMDAGAIGSMVADYPLQLDDVIAPALMLRTADWIWRHCRYAGGFFQDMIHSGINAYLTLALAQTFMRHGDERHAGLIDAVAATASPTGQWPEAVHPRTGGGCMGDGQHTWAAAEWILAMRAVFLREEEDTLVVGSGLRREWLDGQGPLSYGPTSTAWGKVKVSFVRDGSGWYVEVTGTWHGEAPGMHVSVPGYERATLYALGERLALVPKPGHP